MFYIKITEASPKPDSSAKTPQKQDEKMASDAPANELTNKITEQGNVVRDLKANKAKKVKIIKNVSRLT